MIYFINIADFFIKIITISNEYQIISKFYFAKILLDNIYHISYMT